METLELVASNSAIEIPALPRMSILDQDMLTESALDSTTGESVGTSKSLPENDTLPRYEPVDNPIRSGDSYASGFIVPAPHPRCTLSEFGGGLSSLLTKEILSFVAKIDMFDAKWHRLVNSFVRVSKFHFVFQV